MKNPDLKELEYRFTPHENNCSKDHHYYIFGYEAATEQDRPEHKAVVSLLVSGGVTYPSKMGVQYKANAVDTPRHKSAELRGEAMPGTIEAGRLGVLALNLARTVVQFNELHSPTQAIRSE